MPQKARLADVKWNTLSIGAYMNQASLDRVMNLVDTTVFGTAGMARTATLGDASIDVSGFYDVALEPLETDAMAGTARTVKYINDRVAAVGAANPMYSFVALLEGFKGPEATPEGVLTWSAKMSLSDGALPTRATSGTW